MTGRAPARARSLRACVLLATTAALSPLLACGAAATSVVTVVTISPPPEGAVEPAVRPSTPRARSMEIAHEVDDAPPKLAGSWRAPSTNTRFAIEVDDGHASVVDAVDDTVGEHYPITRTRFRGGVLSWSFRIPTTGVVMSYESAGFDGDALRAHWNNDAGGVGDEVLERWLTAGGANGSP